MYYTYTIFNQSNRINAHLFLWLCIIIIIIVLIIIHYFKQYIGNTLQ